VYHLGVSQSERIVWLCEELSVPYTLQRFDRDSTTRMAPAEYKALHPMGVAPVIRDDGLVMAESGAIAEYIIQKYADGRLSVGPGQKNFADYLFWFHFANGTLMPSEMGSMIAASLKLAASDPIMGMLNKRSELAFSMIEKRLGEAAYFAGDEFTAADVMMLFPLTTMRAFVPRPLASMPHLRGYLQKIGERPAYRRAMEKGDPGVSPLLT
jgi:glutathione S-transferase